MGKVGGMVYTYIKIYVYINMYVADGYKYAGFGKSQHN